MVLFNPPSKPSLVDGEDPSHDPAPVDKQESSSDLALNDKQDSSFDPDFFDFPKALAKLAIKTSNPSMPSNFFSRLPPEVLKRVLSLLLVSIKPLVLGVDVNTSVSNGLEPAILRSSHYVYNIGRELL